MLGRRRKFHLRFFLLTVTRISPLSHSQSLFNHQLRSICLTYKLICRLALSPSPPVVNTTSSYGELQDIPEPSLLSISREASQLISSGLLLEDRRESCRLWLRSARKSIQIDQRHVSSTFIVTSDIILSAVAKQLMPSRFAN